MSIPRLSNASVCPASRRAFPDSRLRHAPGIALGLGLLTMALLPAARGYHLWLGWWPLWLVGMPLASGWAQWWFRRSLRHRHRSVP
ncbi:MAG: hypothetical protein LBV45_02540 [Xanthomonadaceae bacterium]|jgi:hypothetical protein|nr:hypothetical protein [Xanthomonadaceae bacterium]